jgi:pyridoxine kinase
MILILSSFVAASPVGGGAQVVALAKLDVESVLAPTVLLGRHPGLGPPGGGAVDAAMFESLLAGIEADGAFAQAEAVICGYFADPAQIALAARTINAVRTARPAMIVVDPIMGDSIGGLYVKPEVARALAVDLVPRADLVAPNAWELGRLTGRVVTSPAEALAAARELGRATLVSSIPAGRAGIGVMWTDGEEAWLAAHDRSEIDPKGAGDLLTALFVAALLGGATPAEALETAVSDVAGQVLGRGVEISLEALG